MGRIIKFVLYFIAAVVALLVIGIISVMALFDVNDYREEIELVVQEKTGRELVIEGEMGMAVFPWLAIEIGETRLGNGAGFGDEPFASFEEASLSIRLFPIILRRDIEITTAELVGLRLNLAVNSDGRSNWQDFIDAADAADATDVAADAADIDSERESGALDISSIEFLDASLSYTDAQSGDRYRLSNVNLTSGRVSLGQPVPLSGSLEFDLQPAGVSGNIEMETVVTFDTDASTVRLDGLSIDGLLEGVTEVPTTLQFETASLEANTAAQTIAIERIEMSLLGLDIAAEVDAFSYANEITPSAVIQVDAFSLRSLMQRLSIEAPETADPTSLGKVIIDATAKISPTAIALTDLTLVLDETTFTGALSIPQGSNDIYRLDLKADSIDLDRYMAPATEGAAASTSDEAPIEIPSELIRLINARGSLTVGNAQLSGMQFDDVKLGLTTNNGNLRLHPINATLFEGQYNGDVRIDASGNTPVMSVNERIEGVQLGALAVAMFEQENITGTINGSFKLSGRGNDLAAIQRSLGGDISMELIDGAWEGTDVWYELRKARAGFRKEPAPEPTLPARTQFSEVSASGPVSNAIFTNTDLKAELPFMQVTGNGSVNFVEATVDYRMSARVLNKPEFFGDDVTQKEIKDFTKTVIPMRVSGPLAAPKIAPDFEKLLKDEAKKSIEKKLKKKLSDLLKP